MKNDIQNQIKRLAEMKRLCQENPMQLDRLKEYQREAMAFDWGKLIISDDPYETGVIHLSKEDCDIIQDALDNPKPPNKALLKAIKEHRKMFSEIPDDELKTFLGIKVLKDAHISNNELRVVDGTGKLLGICKIIDGKPYVEAYEEGK